MSAMDDYEGILLVKNEVFIYKIPPRTTNRAYRAADWNLAGPDWTGRMRLVSKKNECTLKLEDKITGELFAKTPIDKYPGPAIEAVSDSSRYFVIRLQEEDGRTAFIGLGFGDRSDSFDLNVALQDHFKWIKKEEDAEKEKVDGGPSLDLGFKAGQTIKISMNIAKKEGQEGVSRPKVKSAGGGLGFLPPPPGGVKLPPPPAGNSSTPPSLPSPVATSAPQPDNNFGLLGGLSSAPDNPPQPAAGTDSWGDFASANNNSAPPAASSGGGGGAGWVTF